MQLTMKKLVQLTMHMRRGVPRKAKKTNRLNLNSSDADVITCVVTSCHGYGRNVSWTEKE